ncbi:MAG: hypothetical protein H6835_05175 [Planctomycetes bacterium]|nr:hypothetical protein [Planctomycetota bacterium]
MPAAAMLLASIAIAQTPQHLVVPAAYTTADAVSHDWVAGASRAVRQQTLIGASHLTNMVGHDLTAFELRRSAKNEQFVGGAMHWTVTLSIAPHEPLLCSSAYAANVGATPVQVFDGIVTLPTSPAEPGPNVAWDADNVLRVVFQQPFAYSGGTLCIDVLGTPIAGQEANWWMADAMFEDLPGTVVDLGGGCGAYGGPAHVWSSVQERTLVAGGVAHFTAYGPPMSIAIAAFGVGTPVGIPMTALGLPSPPECELHVLTLDGMMAAAMLPHSNPNLVSRGGRADIELKLPETTYVLGLQLTTQWLELTQLATSNALQWSVANAIPTLDMALVESDPSQTNGNVTVFLAHVLRFEYQ